MPTPPRNHVQMLAALITVLCLRLALCDVTQGEKEGYYAFEEAPSRFMRPPQVRKPPYMMSSSPCLTGEGYFSKRPSPKYTLCGDLNKGIIPLNPMGQEFSGQPYPFELIRNKTLVFLSKALPYLKEDKKIPKVAKITSNKKPTYQPITRPNYFDGSRRQVATLYHQRTKRELMPPKKEENVTSEVFSDKNYYEVFDNETTGRQNCDQGGAAGLLCTLTSAMSGSKVPLALMTAMAQSLASSLSPSAPQSSAVDAPDPPPPSPGYSSGLEPSEGSASMTEAVLNLVTTLATMGLANQGAVKHESSLDSNEEEPSTLAHVLSVLTGASPGSSNALSLILKLMASEASPLKALAGGFPSRRRKPSPADDLMTAESSVRRPGQQDGEFDLPPTPCPSSEEYVTPTFARNYQGVWKYVVQIPQEGYFTQTVQQTKCMRNRCEFMDGVCHESPRWVSLLVAEMYYPDTFYPVPTTTVPPPPPVEDFYNFQQYLKRRVGEGDDTTYRMARPAYKEKKAPTKPHCDGVDKIGCYVVRLYYDWFLVNGSCKCWKPSPKRILTGR